MSSNFIVNKCLGKQVAAGTLNELKSSSAEMQRLLESLGQIEEKEKVETVPEIKKKKLGRNFTDFSLTTRIWAHKSRYR